MSLPITLLTVTSPHLVPEVFGGLSDAACDGLLVLVPGSTRSQRSAKRSPWTQTTPRLARWGDGCGCCTVRADLAVKLRKAIASDSPNHAVVVLNSSDALEPVLKTFTVADNHHRRLQDVAHVSRLWVMAEPSKVVTSVGPQPDGGLVERIELADAVVLMGMSSEPSMTPRAMQIVRALNPSATVRSNPQALFGKPAEDEVFQLRRARQRSQEQVTTDETACVRRSRFCAQRPFHPGRLQHALSNVPQGLWRLTGTFWSAARASDVAFVDAFGPQATVRHVGTWMAAIPQSERPAGAMEALFRDGAWDPVHGDRCQDLIVAGEPDAVDQMERALANCLLTAAELGAPETWPTLAQPMLWNSEVV
jgi:G3E family GTPase